MDRNDSQLTLWDAEDNAKEPIKMEEKDSIEIWKLAIVKFDTKRWREGWRPWKKGLTNGPSRG